MKILISEDDHTSRIILEGILKKWGYDPVMTQDGEEAWGELQKPDAPKLVILDWNMPRMSGLEVCRKVREIESPVPPYIIILTSRDEKVHIVEGLDAGANDYIAKPYHNQELLARIKVGQRMVELQLNLHETQQALAYEALHDGLTGVYSRRAILDSLKQEIARANRQGTSLSIAMFDIDHFKKINDTYGHQVGDDVLCAFVQRIKNNLREYDQIGRYGGEEFLVVAPGSKGDKQEGLFERLRSSVEIQEFATRVGNVAITVSIGVAGEATISSLDTMLASADAALYRAKNEGRNRVAYVNESDTRGSCVELRCL